MDDQNEILSQIKEVKTAYQNMLMRKANVVGVGIGFAKQGQETTDQPALVVLVTHKLPADQLAEGDLVPKELDGVLVDVQEVGEISAQA